MAGFEGGRAAREGALDQRLAVLAKHLHIDALLLAELFEEVLGRLGALAFVAPGPFGSQLLDDRMPTEDPGVLIQGAAEQQGQPGDQGDGQPEAGKDAPEQ